LMFATNWLYYQWTGWSLKWPILGGFFKTLEGKVVKP